MTNDHDCLLPLEEVLNLIPVSPSTWWAGVKDGSFPESVKIRGRTFWRRSDVMALIRDGTTSNRARVLDPA
jgi:predicted DNA-binding transcriptional regulator AlpA